MSEMWWAVAGVCGGIVAIAGAAGVIWWLIKPRVTDYIEDVLIRPVRETHHQVTVNHHSSSEPTILDRLDTLTTGLDAHGREIESVQENVSMLHDMLVDHLRNRTD